MAFNYSKLRGKIVEKFGSMAALASHLGISKQAMSHKMTNQTKFSSNDIVTLSQLLEIQPSEIGEYFFDEIV